MKFSLRVLILVIVLVAALPVSLVTAQDGGEDDVMLMAVGSYLQSAEGGEFVDNGDGTYTLTLDGVAEEMLYMANVPVPSLRTTPTWSFVSNWAAVADLTADAVLETGLLNIRLELSTPAYENGTLSFTATVTELVALAELEEGVELALPDKGFGAARLLIVPTIEFQMARVQAIDPAEGDVRGSRPGCPDEEYCPEDHFCRCINCEEWYNAIVAPLQAEFEDLLLQHIEAIGACVAGNAAQCAAANELVKAMQEKAAEISGWMDMYYFHNCPAP